MEFREFSEFDDPESADYDIISSLRENETAKENKHTVLTKEQKMFTELYFDLGAPELFELESFGITESDFEYPTKETIEKLKRYAENFQTTYTHKSR